MDWDGDPELKAMRDSFLVSLEPRRDQLEAWLTSLAMSPTPDAVAGVQYVAHKLAGTAESYGFATITRIGLALDDLIDRAGPGVDGGLICRGGALLSVALEWVIARREDPKHLVKDAVMAELEGKLSLLLTER